MRSEQRAEFVWCHADDVQDAPQGAFGHVVAWVNRNWYCPPVWMMHHMVTATDPRNGESGAFRHLYHL
jgi:hypothetical protein